MERRAYSELLDWKQRGGQKPYLLIGARQTGKTYLVEEFLAREYEQHLTFTLTERPDIVSLFAEAIPTQAKLDRLELIVGHTIDWGRTAIFFDEAQVSEEVLTACKFFAESAVPYQVICAGSLLG
ncbi:MAG: AAA family ATPase, partial [Propionibacteriaceae bacterium]|nr:AAA family ATPase [Propionibacteriaceae bacterium]